MSMEKYTSQPPICNIFKNMSDIILHRYCQTEVNHTCNSLKEMLVNKQLLSGTIFRQPSECIPLNILVVMLKYSGLPLKQPLQ